MTSTNRTTATTAFGERSWIDDLGPSVVGNDEFATLTAAVSALQEAFTRSAPTPESALSLAERISLLTDELNRFEVPEDDQLSGRLWERAGRGQVLAPELHFEQVTPTSVRAHFRIGRFHAGRYALNGGVTPMIFDEVLSRLGNSFGREWARTAHLEIDYRAPAPLHRKLTATGEFGHQDGRKRYLHGEIRDGATLIAEASGLWVVTRP